MGLWCVSLDDVLSEKEEYHTRDDQSYFSCKTFLDCSHSYYWFVTTQKVGKLVEIGVTWIDHLQQKIQSKEGYYHQCKLVVCIIVDTQKSKKSDSKHTICSYANRGLINIPIGRVFVRSHLWNKFSVGHTKKNKI